VKEKIFAGDRNKIMLRVEMQKTRETMWAEKIRPYQILEKRKTSIFQ